MAATWRHKLTALTCSIFICAASKILVASGAEAQSGASKATQRQTIKYVSGVFPGKGNVKDWNYAAAMQGRGSSLRVDKKYDESIATFEKCIASYPYDPEFYNSFALVYYSRAQSGDLLRAEKLIRKAIELNPESYMFWDNLAKGLYEQNKLIESKDALVNALHLNPPPEKLKEIEENLEIVSRRLKKAGVN
ncbi:tetratricopeptide repeat protein [bacterium]|nr:tetratricopeptide repeat protein [bacterium]MBP9810045.1 tetratricopeptide repeat protein [bacterium]